MGGLQARGTSGGRGRGCPEDVGWLTGLSGTGKALLWSLARTDPGLRLAGSHATSAEQTLAALGKPGRAARPLCLHPHLCPPTSAPRAQRLVGFLPPAEGPPPPEMTAGTGHGPSKGCFVSTTRPAHPNPTGMAISAWIFMKSCNYYFFFFLVKGLLRGQSRGLMGKAA